jgi:hypothetical protein
MPNKSGAHLQKLFWVEANLERIDSETITAQEQASQWTLKCETVSQARQKVLNVTAKLQGEEIFGSELGRKKMIVRARNKRFRRLPSRNGTQCNLVSSWSRNSWRYRRE